MSIDTQPTLCVAIMAGGRGQRLWPRSHAAAPKQLQSFFGGPVLLEQSLAAAAALTAPSRTYVVTGADLAERTRALCGPGIQVLAEPCGRETAACAGLAALHAERAHPGAVLVLLPADQWIGDPAGFVRTLSTAAALAAGEQTVVTVGVPPTRPETGYGYIQAEHRPDGSLAGTGFREKPDAATAARLIAAGDAFWNAGIYVVPAALLLKLIERFLPTLSSGLSRIAGAMGTSRESATLQEVYRGLPASSLDRGIAEKLDRFLVVPAQFAWDDLGSWAAFSRVLPRDRSGNLAAGPVVACDATGCVVDTPGLTTTLLGVTDLIVVREGDQLLVASAERAQDVRRVAEANGGREAAS